MNNKFSFARYISIVKKEIIQLKRDKISARIPIVMPVMMMLLFGYVVNTEVDHVKTAVFDQCKTQESRAYIDKFKNTGYFEITTSVNSSKEIEYLMDSGEIKAAIYIPADFSKDIKSGNYPQVLLEIDGSDSTVAGTVLSRGVLIAQMDAMETFEKRMSKMGISNINMKQAGIHTRVKYNPNMEIRYFTIPGLVGIIVMNTTIMLTAFAMVRERERGTIEQLVVTPIKSNELILGKLTPYVFVGSIGFLFSLAICRFYFKINILGNLSILLVLGLLFVICSLSVGMLISTFVKNQLQAMFMVIVTILPSILLSGFLFPIEAMPSILQPVTNILPVTFFLKIMRGIVLKGAGMDILWREVVALLLFMVVTLSFSIVRFKKNLD